MATTTIVFGLLLIALGLGGYYGTGTSSLTALIPAAFGIALAGCGLLARNPERRKLAMHIAVGLAAVGYIACVPGLFKLPSVLAHQEVARPAAVWSQSIMAMLTGFYLVFAIKSFRDARKGRQA
ncbi:MAG: hypothetical protein ABJF23_05175 [Bryobacteraceae bacterium]